ncbi:MAG: GDSL-type esterase/lipase family protein [Phycisphaerales bacterium]
MPIARRTFLGAIASVAIAVSSALTAAQDKQAPAATKPVSVTPVPRSDEGILQRQTEVLRRVKEAKTPVPLVFIGDSITQGWEGNGKDVWASSIAPLASAVLNIGVSGDRTEHVLWRLGQAPLDKLDARCIVLMIGTNNLGHGSSNAADTALGVRTIVDTLVEQCPKAKIVVLGIFPRGETMNAMRGDICQINQSLAAFAAQHPSHRVQLLDIGATFVEPDGTIKKDIMPDFLHLSKAGYQRWADAVAPAIKSNLSAS